MKDKERVCSDEGLPLVLNVADIQRIMGIPSWGPPQNRKFCGKRRRSGASEFSRLRGNERSAACDDESAYELVHQPGFPAVKSGRLIKIGKQAFFDWLERGGMDCQSR